MLEARTSFATGLPFFWNFLTALQTWLATPKGMPTPAGCDTRDCRFLPHNVRRAKTGTGYDDGMR
jgi:hypothetical protein